MNKITFLDSQAPCFPDPDKALANPNGLLAAGGNLLPDTLIEAYQKGIFPWYSGDEPLLWWSPDPRAVIFPKKFHISRSLAKLWRQQRYQITFDTAFDQVVECCSQPRDQQRETWITIDMQQAYIQLHQLGHAHSVEIWNQNQLVGGLYGVSVGGIFCGESMFSKVGNASKLALLALIKLGSGLQLIDCQLPNPHLFSLGAETMPRSTFIQSIKAYKAFNIQFSD